jgi:hypothetical protein
MLGRIIEAVAGPKKRFDQNIAYFRPRGDKERLQNRYYCFGLDAQNTLNHNLRSDIVKILSNPLALRPWTVVGFTPGKVVGPSTMDLPDAKYEGASIWPRSLLNNCGFLWENGSTQQILI